MRVEPYKKDDGKLVYILLDNSFKPIEPAMKYLKYLDNVNKSSNTLKTYANALRLYFEYLSVIDKEYGDININNMSDFVGWLQNPYFSPNVVNICPGESSKSRAKSSINLTTTVVLNFYDYCYRTGVLDFNLMDKSIKEISCSDSMKKGFFAHLNRDGKGKKSILKLKEDKVTLKYFEDDEIEILMEATTNIRDKFLLQLLHETGFRIGEALSLNHEDFIINKKKNIYEIKLAERGILENGASLKTGVRTVPVSAYLADLFDDYEYEVLDEIGVRTQFIFVKLKGNNIGEPLEYTDVNNLFRELKRKTDIDATPHMFRHTHATIFYRETKDIEAVRDRLGHANIGTTIDLYVHSNQDDKRKAWQKAEHAFKTPVFENNNEIPF